MHKGKPRGFSIIELLVVIGIIAVLLSILFPMAERMRHRAYIDACASNLRQIGQALAVYASDNGGAYPRARYEPDHDWVAGNNHSSPGIFDPSPHASNDVTAAVYLLMREESLPAKLFICPYNDVKVYVADPEDAYTHGNFTDYRMNLGYSIQNMYAGIDAVAKGFKWTNKFGPDFAIAADLNPGAGDKAPFDQLTGVTPTSTNAIREQGNSRNHENEGQNVLFGDGHVSYATTCLSGVNQDNIYMNHQGNVRGSPADKDDSMLLPFEGAP